MRSEPSLGVILVLAMLLAACASDGEPTQEGAADPAQATEMKGPAPIVPEQGGTYWGVYLAVGYPAHMEGMTSFLTDEVGLEPGVEFANGEMSCDEGAAEGLDNTAPNRVAVYFDSREDAEAWVDAWLDEEPVGIVEVATLCAP